MNIVITGDLLPTPNNERLFCNGDAETLVGKEILNIFQNADFRICNMEGPLTDEETAIDKSGPAIKGSSNAIKGIKALGMDCVSIANNHILDYGERGLEDTLRVLVASGIDYVGAGRNLLEAKKPYIVEIEGTRIGIYSCAEYEFTIATDAKGGANPFDALEIADEIRKLKEQCDIAIVLYHGGKEFYRYPVPYVQKRCRKMADAGADFVLCQHSHCIGAYEEYNGCSILYGQGNFLFCRADDEYRHTGMIVRITVNNGRKNMEFIPVVRHDETVRLADTSEKKEIMDGFLERSGKAKDNDFLKKNYREFALSCVFLYYKNNMGLLGELWCRFRLSRFMLRLFRPRHHLWLLNEIRCEAHADIFREGIEGILEK